MIILPRTYATVPIIQHFPFAKIFNGAFETEPTEDYMLLQLASCHIRKTDVIFFVVLDNTDVCILNSNLCHWAYAFGFQP